MNTSLANGAPAPSYQYSVDKKSSSLDIPQRLERKLAQYNRSQNVCKRWLFEIFSVMTSAVCMGAIIAILAVLQDKPLQTWPLGLTFTTVLAKIASAALILPISEAIGQLKWLWFRGKHSKDAFDFEIFDKASRGAWGSFLLLLRTRGKSLAALGAVLTVFLLAIDTFFQQVTDLPERWTYYGQSRIARTIQFKPTKMLQYTNDIAVVSGNLNLRGALFPYFYDQNGTQELPEGTTKQAPIPISCPTSKCEWEPYQTLGICSSCVDVSELLQFGCRSMRMDWIRKSIMDYNVEHTQPNGTACGYFLNVTSNAPTLMSGYRVDTINASIIGETLLMRTLPLVTNPRRLPLYGGSINFKHINHRLLDALIVSAINGTAASVYEKRRPIAHECVLAWCVKTIRSSYTWGRYDEDVVDTFLNTTEVPYPWNTVRGPTEDLFDTTYRGNISLYPPGVGRGGEGFGLSNSTLLDFSDALDEVFPSLITIANATSEPFLKIRTGFIDKVVYRAFKFNPWLDPNNVTNHMRRISIALTNAIRSDATTNDLVVGRALTSVTFVTVHWAWLTFPLVMLALAVIFLIATMMKTSGATGGDIGNWKTSAMPTLLYSLPEEARNDLTAATTWSSNGSTERPRKVKIRLMPKQGWRVSGHALGSPTIFGRNNRTAPPGWI